MKIILNTSYQIKNQVRWRQVFTWILMIPLAVSSLLGLGYKYFNHQVLSFNDYAEKYPTFTSDYQRCFNDINKDFDWCLSGVFKSPLYQSDVCRLLPDGGIKKASCYRQFPGSFEKQLYFFYTEFATFALIILLIFFFGSILGSKLGGFMVVSSILYDIGLDIFADVNGLILAPWLSPPLKTVWIALPALVFGLAGYLIERWLISKNSANKIYEE